MYISSRILQIDAGTNHLLLEFSREMMPHMGVVVGQHHELIVRGDRRLLGLEFELLAACRSAGVIRTNVRLSRVVCLT